MSNANPGDLFDRWLQHHEQPAADDKPAEAAADAAPEAPAAPAEPAGDVAIQDTKSSREAARALLEQAKASGQSLDLDDVSAAPPAPPAPPAAAAPPTPPAAAAPPAPPAAPTPPPAPPVAPPAPPAAQTPVAPPSHAAEPPVGGARARTTESEGAAIIDLNQSSRRLRRGAQQPPSDAAPPAPPAPAAPVTPPAPPAPPVVEQPTYTPPPAPATPPAPPAPPVVEQPTYTPPPTPATPPAAPMVESNGGVPAVVEFTPKKTARRTADMGLVGAGVGALVFGGLAAAGMTWAIAVAAMLGALALVLLLTRASSHPVKMIVKRGLLEVERSNGWKKYDLKNPDTKVAVTATPGDPRWKVVIINTDAQQCVVDESMVDGREFMRVLRHYRPEL